MAFVWVVIVLKEQDLHQGRVYLTFKTLRKIPVYITVIPNRLSSAVQISVVVVSNPG